MAAIDFPNSPSVNDVFDVAGKKWLYDGSSWNLIAVAVTAGVTSLNGSTGVITGIATLASPTFTGNVTLPSNTVATTQTVADNTTKVATTAFVTTADNLKANLASPTFTGTPTLPTGTIATTQTASNNTTAVATTAYVDTADALKANLASPTFTGSVTGNPAAGTTSTGTSGFGYMGLPQNATTTGAYGVLASDAGKHIYSTATRTITIPANATIAMPIGSTVVFIAGSGATVTIAITTDTMYLAGLGTTGSRTLAAFGMATAVKITSTSWIISGNGLT